MLKTLSPQVKTNTITTKWNKTLLIIFTEKDKFYYSHLFKY